MDYRKFDHTYFLRIDRGEEITEKLKEFALKENIRLASVSALGATDYFIAGVYSIPEQKYYQNSFEGVYEITNITGTINTMNSQFYSHLHITCSDTEGRCFGGHLNYARVSATCEMVITVFDGIVERTKDPSTGINLFDFSKE